MKPVLNALFPLLLRTPDSSAGSMMRAITLPSSQLAGKYMHNDKIGRPTRVSTYGNMMCVCVGGGVVLVGWGHKNGGGEG